MMKISQEPEFLIFISNSSMTSSNMVSKIKIHNRSRPLCSFDSTRKIMQKSGLTLFYTIIFD